MLHTLFKSLRGTEWELLTGFVSPAFFDVVPVLSMARAFGTILTEYVNPIKFEAALKASAYLTSKFEGVALDSPELKARAVLEIYFRQIFDKDFVLLDLRSSAFKFTDDKIFWNPKPLFYVWDENFIKSIRQLYSEFYGNNEKDFLGALASLDLSHAAEIFRSHFGVGDQSSLRFSLADFKKSFQLIFESCKKHKTKLHPDFFALGAYLLCLYGHAESLDVAVNVRGAFDAAASNRLGTPLVSSRSSH